MSETNARCLADHASLAERERAAAFRRPADQHRSLVAHGAKRVILARYVGCEPADLTFAEGEVGKPALAGPAAACGLPFNLAHSGNLVLVAVTGGQAVGVDVERHRPVPAAADLAERYFCPEERDYLAAQADTAAAERAFLRLWAAKEAFVKATGEGLQRPLNSFAIDSGDADALRLLWQRDDPGATARWWLTSFVPAPGYVAAVAVDRGCGQAGPGNWSPYRT